MRLLVKITIGLLVLGLLGGVAIPALWSYWQNHNKPSFRQTAVSRGEIIQWVKSTGTVKPVLIVQVGSFVSGPIQKVYVDFNAVVKKDDVLAEVDPKTYQAQLSQANAALDSAKANLLQATARLEQMRREWKRAEDLLPDKAISDTDYDLAKVNYLSAEASIASAAAAIKQNEAAVKQVQTNLDYTVIKSPVDGVVIDRKVDPGQTVAATYQTPELFRVAPDLEKRVFIYASVDEADIGLIRNAKERQQPVMFTVDAYPDDLFEGKVYQVRLNSIVLQNVVTYSVIVEASNTDLKLLPGMTASLSFQIDKRDDVLRVPNAALRFFPSKPEHVRPEDRWLVEGSDQPTPEENEARTVDTQLSAVEKVEASRKRNRRHVWVVENDLLKAVEVVIGLSDSQCSEVVSGDLDDGQSVVTWLNP
jgi:HlyD family secretion protein